MCIGPKSFNNLFYCIITSISSINIEKWITISHYQCWFLSRITD